MVFLRALLRGLLLLIIAFSLSIWISLATLNATVFDRAVVKNWLDKSGIYGHALTDLIRTEASSAAPQVLSQTVLLTALSATFTPDYMREQTNKVLDATYDWLEGKKEAITFNIAIQDKRAEFGQQLAAAIEPHVRELPQCANGSDTRDGICVPKGVAPAAFSQQFAAQALDGASFLDQPLTEKMFVPAQGGLNLPFDLPAAYAQRGNVLIVLPFVMLLGSVAYVFLSSTRQRGLLVIGRRFFFGAVTALVGGVLMWTLGGTLDISRLPALDPAQAQMFGKVIQPVLRVAVPEIGVWLSLFSGIFAVAGLALWITMAVIQRRKRRRIEKAPLQPPYIQGQTGAALPTPGTLPPPIDSQNPPSPGPIDLPKPKV